MKRILLLAIVFVVLNMPISCDHCSGRSDMRISDLAIEKGSWKPSIFLNEESSAWNELAYKISIKQLAHNTKRHILGLTSPAYACDPLFTSNTRLTDLVIINTDEITFQNNDYTAGSNIAESFYIANHDLSLEQYTISQQNDLTIFNHYGDYIILTLNKQPTQGIDQTIQIKFEFDNAESIILETRLFIEV